MTGMCLEKWFRTKRSSTRVFTYCNVRLQGKDNKSKVANCRDYKPFDGLMAEQNNGENLKFLSDELDIASCTWTADDDVCICVY